MWRLRDVLELRELAAPQLPPHLVGVPSCLHKYEPLLLRDWERQQADREAVA